MSGGECRWPLQGHTALPAVCTSRERCSAGHHIRACSLVVYELEACQVPESAATLTTCPGWPNSGDFQSLALSILFPGHSLASDL